MSRISHCFLSYRLEQQQTLQETNLKGFNYGVVIKDEAPRWAPTNISAISQIDLQTFIYATLREGVCTSLEPPILGIGNIQSTI